MYNISTCTYGHHVLETFERQKDVFGPSKAEQDAFTHLL